MHLHSHNSPPRPRPALPIGLVALLSVSLLGLACNDTPEPDPPGVLSLGWRVSPLGCSESGVTTIELRLDGPEAITDIYTCDDQRAVIDPIEPGAYNLTLTGRDSNGKAIFESAPDTAVGISPGKVTEVEPLRLTARTGTLYLSWYFENGRLCSHNGVDKVTIGLYDLDAFAIGETSATCSDAEAVIEGVKSGEYLIEAIGSGPDGAGVFRAVQPITVDRGDERSTELVLAPCEGGC